MDQQMIGYAVQVVFAALMSFVLQGLKNWKWFPFLNEWSAKWWKVAVSAIVAGASAAGISFQFDPVIGQLVITGLTWAAVGHALLAFAVSFATQHVSYEGMAKKMMPGKVAAILLAVAIGGMAVSGCAAKTPLAKHQVAALSAGKAALGIDQAEYDTYGAGAYSAAEHARLGTPIRSLLYTVRGYERAVAAWTGDPYAPPEAVAKARAAVAASIDDLEAALKPVKGADRIHAAIRTFKVALGFPLTPADGLPAPTQAGLPILALLLLIMKTYQERDKDGTTGHFFAEMIAALKKAGASQEELAALDMELTAAIDRREHEAPQAAEVAK